MDGSLLRQERLDTPYGPAHLSFTGTAVRGTALLMHGAGTSTDVPLLTGLADALAADGWRAVRLDQPYIVAGRRTPPPTKALDLVVDLAAAQVAPTFAVGRSSGARAACRLGARRPDGLRRIACVGFPFSPPGRPEVTRAGELAACGVPVLVVQGTRDSFGGPERITGLGLPHVSVHAVDGGDHTLRTRKADGRTGEQAVAEAIGVLVAYAALT